MFETRTVRALKGLFLLLLFGAVAGVVALHAFNPARGARMAMLQDHHDRLRSSLSSLAERRRALQAELGALATDEDRWREVARRELGMIAEGEVVYRFPRSEREPTGLLDAVRKGTPTAER